MLIFLAIETPCGVIKSPMLQTNRLLPFLSSSVRIDAANIAPIVGTIAGDDTIFIAVKDASAQKLVTKKAREIFEK